MIRTLAINGNEGSYDEPSFLLTENEGLLIVIKDLPKVKNGIYYFVASHGEYSQTTCLNSVKTVVVSPEWIEKGGVNPLLATIELRDKTGRIVLKTYDVEPLEVKKTTAGKEYYSAVKRIETENEMLRVLVGTFDARLARLEKRVECYEKNGVELIFEEEGVERND
jgi:hypothetical protein